MNQKTSGYASDGDPGFIGLNSRDNPVTLQPGYLTKSQNIRINRGTARTRLGSRKFSFSGIETSEVMGSCVFLNSDKKEMFIIVVTDGIYVYDPDTNIESIKIEFPSGHTISASDDVDVYQAQNKVYIIRGLNNLVLRWDGIIGATGHIVVPSNTTHHNYPNSKHGIYYGNRHIVQTNHNTIRVSHYLEDSKWSALDMFTINDGTNDQIVGIAPWTLNEFVIFMRNSTFYASVGVGAYLLSDPATEDNSYVKSLATDIGCLARKSVVQAGGGILFLSDNGVYILNPASAAGASQSSPEGMRLLTLAEPLSAPIDDIIQRINITHAHKSVGIYWESRYYLAVPLDDSETNNTILVYNFLNKSWESIDKYPDGFDVKNFHVAKRDKRRRLWAVDSNEGIFLLEELEWDEFGGAQGTPVLDNVLSRLDTEGCRFSEIQYFPNLVEGILISRAYIFGAHDEKRFSSLQTDLNFQNFGEIKIDFITINQDSTTRLVDFNPTTTSDFLVRLPVRKTAYAAQVKLSTNAYNPSIRAIYVDAVPIGRNTITRP